MVFGQQVKSKVTGAVGILTGISGDKLLVSFNGRDPVKAPANTLEMGEEMMTAIQYLISEEKTPVKKKVVNSGGSSRRISPLIAKTPSMIFFNTAYMKEYNGITVDDIPYNGGKYVDETGNAGEKYNFAPFDDEFVYGFAEPGHTKGGWKNGSQKELHIEKIDPSCMGSDHLDDVIVVMCANSPLLSKTVVVGWYNHATVYRNPKVFDIGGEKHWMICKCRIEDAHLIEEKDRDFTIPRAAKDGTGFGQANYWYANQDKDYEFRLKVLDYLKQSV